MVTLRKRFHYVAGSSILPPTATQDISLLRKAMLSLFVNDLDKDSLVKNIKSVCSPAEFESIRVNLMLQSSERATENGQLCTGITTEDWQAEANLMHKKIAAASEQEILIRAGHIFRPEFQRFVRKMANKFRCRGDKNSSDPLKEGYKIREKDKCTERMEAKERDPDASCYQRPEKHTDILAGMLLPETNTMMQRISNFFCPYNNSSTVGFKPKFVRPDDTGFGGINLTTTMYVDIGSFKKVPFIVELQVHKKSAYKAAYRLTHEKMEKERAFDAWARHADLDSDAYNQPDVFEKWGRRLMGFAHMRSITNKKANESLAELQQKHEYHIVDETPVISVTSPRGVEHSHCLVPRYREDRDNTYLVIDNAYEERISNNTLVSRVMCIDRMHIIAHNHMKYPDTASTPKPPK